MELIKTLKNVNSELTREEEIIHNPYLKFNFDWKNATDKFVELRQESNVYNWLTPIIFSIKLGFIIEIMKNNMDYILKDREKAFSLICSKLQITQSSFYSSIYELQDILIRSRKVKVCKNGKVILMNDI